MSCPLIDSTFYGIKKKEIPALNMCFFIGSYPQTCASPFSVRLIRTQNVRRQLMICGHWRLVFQPRLVATNWIVVVSSGLGLVLWNWSGRDHILSSFHATQRAEWFLLKAVGPWQTTSDDVIVDPAAVDRKSSNSNISNVRIWIWFSYPAISRSQQHHIGARGLVLCNDFELSLLGSMRRKRCLCEVAVKEQSWG